jgi:hypothetical protein
MLLRGEAIAAEILPDFGMSIASLRDGSSRAASSGPGGGNGGGSGARGGIVRGP